MRSVVLLDTKIDKDEALALLKEYGDWYEEMTGVKCTFWLERRDFTTVPTVPDADGDLKPTDAYRQGIADEIHARYHDYGTDNIITWVHEDNFLYKGVWGTAWSYVHHKYNYLLCRWDKDNTINTFNTLFHEGEHPADRLIKEELGIDINPLIAKHFGYTSFSFDRDYVHGNHPDWQYIGKKGYQRDGRMLQFLAPYLRAAYQKRKEKHDAYVQSLQRTVIKLVTTLLSLVKRVI